MKKRGILKGWHRALIIILPYIYMAGMFAFLGGIVSGVRNFSANRHPTFFQTFVMSVFHLFATVVVQNVGIELILLLFLEPQVKYLSLILCSTKFVIQDELNP